MWTLYDMCIKAAITTPTANLQFLHKKVMLLIMLLNSEKVLEVSCCSVFLGWGGKESFRYQIDSELCLK